MAGCFRGRLGCLFKVKKKLENRKKDHKKERNKKTKSGSLTSVFCILFLSNKTLLYFSTSDNYYQILQNLIIVLSLLTGNFADFSFYLFLYFYNLFNQLVNFISAIVCIYLSIFLVTILSI